MILNKLNVFVQNDEKSEQKYENVIDINSHEIIENEVNEEEEESASRNILVKQLLKQGTFNFACYIENEVTASALILFKSLAKYYEIPFQEVNKISTDPTYKEKLSEKEYTGWLPKAVEDFGLDWQDVWEPVHKRMDFCYRLAGIAHNKSVAASGVIMATGKTVLPVHDGAIGYNSVDLEQWGYIKYDLLSVNTLNSIQYFKGVDFDWNENDNKKVWESIKNGDLDFTFQLSGFVPKEMCVKGLGALDEREKEEMKCEAGGTKNRDLTAGEAGSKVDELLEIGEAGKKAAKLLEIGEDGEKLYYKGSGVKTNENHWWNHGVDRISEVSAVNRPGPLSIDMDKIWIDLQANKFEYTDKNDMIINRVLKSGLGDQHLGLIMYQEDIMSLCSSGADFTLAEADDVRKGMGKKKQELIDAKAPQFINNWKYHDIFEIDGLGFFKSDDKIELTNGSTISASDLYELVNSGQSVDVVAPKEI